MKPIFNVDELSLMTPDEKDVINKYTKLCGEFLSGNGDTIKMKVATSAIAVIAKTIQSRTVVANLKLQILQTYDSGIIQSMVNDEKDIYMIEDVNEEAEEEEEVAESLDTEKKEG